jgi:hypothetical protein
VGGRRPVERATTVRLYSHKRQVRPIAIGSAQSYIADVRSLVISLLAGLALVTPVVAEMQCPGRYNPPAEFVYEPTTPYWLVVWPDEMLRAVCSGGMPFAPAGALRGCSFDAGDGFWFIYINADLDERQRACTERHEKAHVNGWTHGPMWANYQDENGAHRPAPGSRHRRVKAGAF